MKSKTFWLSVSYWWAIIADAMMAVLMVSPNLYLRFMNVELLSGPGIQYGLLNGVPLMVGWTLLLFWASRKPVERKAILLLTLPVITGYVIVEVYAIFVGWTSWLQTLPILILQAGLCISITTSLLNARTRG